MDLALNNLQSLICHNTQQTNKSLLLLNFGDLTATGTHSVTWPQGDVAIQKNLCLKLKIASDQQFSVSSEPLK